MKAWRPMAQTPTMSVDCSLTSHQIKNPVSHYYLDWNEGEWNGMEWKEWNGMEWKRNGMEWNERGEWKKGPAYYEILKNYFMKMDYLALVFTGDSAHAAVIRKRKPEINKLKT